MNVRKKLLLAALVAPAFVAATAYAAEPGFYIGLSGGETTMKASTDVDVQGPVVNPLAPDIRQFELDGEETGYKGYLGYNFAPWFGVEGGYVELGNISKHFPVGTSRVDAELDVGGWEAFVVGTLPLGAFDLFVKVGGFTGDIKLDGNVDFANGQTRNFSGDTDNSDAILAYGGGAAWNFGHWSLRAEYEEYDADGMDDLYFVSAGLVYRFFEDKSEPVAAAEPAPAPVVAAAPAQCADADADGVCDADDQCPDTKAGTRVGTAGCNCDYVFNTHFAFDSSELTAEDMTELDRLAGILTKVNFITGKVDGYTDSVGDAAYNKTLSKMRADAVVNYLRSKGVQMSDRVETQGFGEEDPVADNSTEEGRAQNRRATLRRTDCGPAQ